MAAQEDKTLYRDLEELTHQFTQEPERVLTTIFAKSEPLWQNRPLRFYFYLMKNLNPGRYKDFPAEMNKETVEKWLESFSDDTGGFLKLRHYITEDTAFLSEE